MIVKSLIRLALEDSADGKLPTEFRLFAPGWNATENGKYLFDGAAAKSVMAAYQAWGVDLAIDLEHQMLDEQTADPTGRDARGWCRLEVRPDGSLWACDVRWTPDGAARLSEKRQRYVSPAFKSDPKTKRVLKVVNIAITAIPATHKTPALVAASRNGKRRVMLERARKLVRLASEMGLDKSLIKQALDAVEKGDAKAALEILKNLIASAAGADPDEGESDDPGSADDGAEGTAPPAETQAVEHPEVVDNSAAGDGNGEDEDDEDDDKPAKKAERKAMRAMLRRLTGSKTFAEALSTVAEFRASHLTLASEREKIAKDREALERAERRGLLVELIKLGAEFPATVWADDKAKAPKARWAKMPLAELRAHVVDQKAARPGKKPAGGEIKPPHGGDAADPDAALDAEVAQLSARELAICKDENCEPKDFVRLRRFSRPANTSGKGN